MFCKPGAWAPVACLLLLAGCHRSRPAPERISIPRFENLSADPSLDWMGRAFEQILEGQLSGTPRRQVSSTTSGANRMVYGRYFTRGGRLRVDVSVEDPGTLRIVQTASATAPLASGIFAIADAVARQLGGAIRPYETRSEAALKSYGAALDAPDPASADKELAAAVQADPNFGEAYVSWARLQMERRDRAGLARVLELARGRGAAIPEIDRARLDYLAAILNRDAAGQARALTALARLDPADPATWRALAENAINAHRFPDAARLLEKAAALTPDDAVVWNRLGYVRAYAQDLEGALDALRRYEQLLPQDANPSDSQGDVYFYFGRFAGAEKSYLEANRKDPNFLGGATLRKAAQARLMTGDIAAADGLFRRYAEYRKSVRDGLIEYQAAQWQFLTGRRREAVARLDAFAQKADRVPAVSARARAQIAVWALALGDRTRAGEQARKAVAAAGAPDFAALALYLTQPDSVPPPALKDMAQAYALLFRKEFASAAPLIKQMYERSNLDTEGGLPVLLAWCYLETGRFADAAPLLRFNPVPQGAGLDPFDFLYFPRLYFLRAEQEQKAGNVTQAKRDYGLFLQLSGSAPLIWGEDPKGPQIPTAGIPIPATSYHPPARRRR